MSEERLHALGEGALLIVVGMLVVFAALFILMVAIMIMNRLFPEKEKKEVAQPPYFELGASEKERIAAIAVAMAKAMEGEEAALTEQRGVNEAGGSNEASRWAVAGREQAMRSRGKAGRQWGRRSD